MSPLNREMRAVLRGLARVNEAWVEDLAKLAGREPTATLRGLAHAGLIIASVDKSDPLCPTVRWRLTEAGHAMAAALAGVST